MEKLFELILQLIGLVETQIFQPRTVMTDCRIGAHRRFQHAIINAVDFEAEENQRGVRVCQLLLHIAKKFHTLGVGRVAIVIKASERRDAPHHFA